MLQVVAHEIRYKCNWIESIVGLVYSFNNELCTLMLQL